jgi:hypothetical protein
MTISMASIEQAEKENKTGDILAAIIAGIGLLSMDSRLVLVLA